MAIELEDRFNPPPDERGKPYTFYGQNAAFLSADAHEVILSGPAETGKTITALYRLNQLAWDNPGLQAAVIRKIYADMPGSVLEIFEKKILPFPPSDPRCLIHAYGGKKPERYLYPNGSTIWVGGMDHPSRVLSAERDIIYVNQSEELTLEDWETLGTRVTGRAGTLSHAQLIGDCNPGPRMHWIKQRAESGAITLIESRHIENPVLYNQETMELTGQGVRTMAVLDALTGGRKERLRWGRWASAEGMVYEEWDAAIHLIDPFPIPPEWKRYRAIDFGYTNPFVCLWFAMDGDGRIYLYREIYMSQRLVEDHAKQIVALSKSERILATFADHDAEDRATLERHGVPTLPAAKDISAGIQTVKSYLQRAGDGKPRFMILRNALVERDKRLEELRKPWSTEQEIEGYIWQKTPDGRPIKELPLDLDNHGVDSVRYELHSLVKQRARWRRAKGLY